MASNASMWSKRCDGSAVVTGIPFSYLGLVRYVLLLEQGGINPQLQELALHKCNYFYR